MSCDTRPSTIGVDLTPGRRTSSAITIASPSINVIQSDGFSSPRDSAHTPPGIVTKIETRMYKHSNPGSTTSLKCICTNCLKDKENSLCKQCTKEKLKFYSRKETLAQKQQEKIHLSEKIDAVAGASCQLAAEANSTVERIEALKRLIEEKRARIEKKKKENTRLRRSISRHVDNTSKFEPCFEKLQKMEAHWAKREAKRRGDLGLKLKEISKLRRDLGLILSGIFPVTEVLAEVVHSKPSTNWALVSRTDPVLGNIFQIRGMNCPDDEILIKLASGLTQSPLELAPELRPYYASFLLTVQLVNLLAYIMDVRLPYSIGLKEISLRDRWTKELLDDEWFRLCKCILILGLRIGMAPETLHFYCPHSNLIEIGQHIYQGKIVESLQPIGHEGNHCETVASGKISERELPDWDIIDGEDF